MVDSRIKTYESLLGRPLKKILEVGCGDAAWAKAFIERGIQYQGLEIIPSLVDFSQKKGLQVDLCELQKWCRWEEYDVIFASQVVEHVTTPVAFILDAVKCLKPGGIVHFDVPNHSGLISLVHKYLHANRRYGAIEPPHHLIGYSPLSMKTLLERANLEPVLVEGLRNDDPRLGQILLKSSMLNRLVYVLGGLIGRGSLLTGIAKKKGSTP